MIDAATQKPLHVLDGDTDWPSIPVPESPFGRLLQLLDRHGIRRATWCLVRKLITDISDVAFEKTS